MSDKQKLVVAVSSRALFDLDESHNIFETEGKEAFCRYQIEHEDEILEPGLGYALVTKLLAINNAFPDAPLVEVILLSQNSADTGLRIFNSIAQHKLNISRAAFTSGMSPYGYISAFGAHLFLSANADDVVKALNSGVAAATILSGSSNTRHADQLRPGSMTPSPCSLIIEEAQEGVSSLCPKAWHFSAAVSTRSTSVT